MGLPPVSAEKERSASQQKAPEPGLRGVKGFKTYDFGSSPRAGADLVGVEGIFSDLPPQILIAAEGGYRIPDFLEVRVLGGSFRINLVRGLVAGVHDLRREGMQLRPVRHQP